MLSPLDDSGDVRGVVDLVGFLPPRLPLEVFRLLSLRLRRPPDFERFEAPAATGSWLFSTSGPSTLLPLFWELWLFVSDDDDFRLVGGTLRERVPRVDPHKKSRCCHPLRIFNAFSMWSSTETPLLPSTESLGFSDVPLQPTQNDFVPRELGKSGLNSWWVQH